MADLATPMPASLHTTFMFCFFAGADPQTLKQTTAERDTPPCLDSGFPPHSSDSDDDRPLGFALPSRRYFERQGQVTNIESSSPAGSYPPEPEIGMGEASLPSGDDCLRHQDPTIRPQPFRRVVLRPNSRPRSDEHQSPDLRAAKMDQRSEAGRDLSPSPEASPMQMKQTDDEQPLQATPPRNEPFQAKPKEHLELRASLEAGLSEEVPPSIPMAKPETSLLHASAEMHEGQPNDSALLSQQPLNSRPESEAQLAHIAHASTKVQQVAEQSNGKAVPPFSEHQGGTGEAFAGLMKRATHSAENSPKDETPQEIEGAEEKPPNNQAAGIPKEGCSKKTSPADISQHTSEPDAEKQPCDDQPLDGILPRESLQSSEPLPEAQPILDSEPHKIISLPQEQETHKVSTGAAASHESLDPGDSRGDDQGDTNAGHGGPKLRERPAEQTTSEAREHYLSALGLQIIQKSLRTGRDLGSQSMIQEDTAAPVEKVNLQKADKVEEGMRPVARKSFDPGFIIPDSDDEEL